MDSKSHLGKVQDVANTENNKMGFTPEQWINIGDQWLIENGVISDVTHNNIIMNLYMNFPKAKYIEYYMSPEDCEMEVHLFFGWWNYMFQKDQELTIEAQNLIRQYLKNFRVTAKKRRYGRREATRD